MRYYHYGYKNNRTSVEQDELEECFIAEMGNINNNKRNVYNSRLVIEDDTIYEIDEECVRCRK